MQSLGDPFGGADRVQGEGDDADRLPVVDPLQLGLGVDVVGFPDLGRDDRLPA